MDLYDDFEGLKRVWSEQSGGGQAFLKLKPTEVITLFRFIGGKIILVGPSLNQ